MNVVMLSLWRNDVGRGLTERAAHLLDKTYPDLEWVWVVGDSTDTTVDALCDIQASHPRGWGAAVVDIGATAVPSDDPHARMLRLSRAAQAGLDRLTSADDVVLIHESDIESPPDIVERLLVVEGDVVGAWPTLGPDGPFYDTWAYRGLDGQHFTGDSPYHADYRPDAPFEVQSVGTCWLFPAAAVRRGLGCTRLGAVELCAGLRRQGYRIWCDPRVRVVQPMATFVPHTYPVEVA